jgi:hypothetical protein
MEGQLAFIEPLKQLLQNPEVKELVDQSVESARIYVTNSGFTVNLIPALIVLALASILILPFLGIPILDIILSTFNLGGGGGGGYGEAASSGYGYAARGDYSYDQTIATLQEKVAALQESEATLRNAVYYGAEQGTGNVGYTN